MFCKKPLKMPKFYLIFRIKHPAKQIITVKAGCFKMENNQNKNEQNKNEQNKQNQNKNNQNKNEQNKNEQNKNRK